LFELILQLARMNV